MQRAHCIFGLRVAPRHDEKQRFVTFQRPPAQIVEQAVDEEELTERSGAVSSEEELGKKWHLTNREKKQTVDCCHWSHYVN